MNRLKALILTIPLALPLAAGAPARKWTIGDHGASPSLTGHFVKSGEAQGEFDTNFDLDRDFGLKADGMSMGLFASYNGPRFGLSLDYTASDFAGDSTITTAGNVDLPFGGGNFVANTRVVSALSTAIYDLNWTIKVWRPRGAWGSAWLGIDLGVQAWSIDAEATGTARVKVTVTGPDGNPYEQDGEETRTYKIDPIFAPVPQVGLSAGVTAFRDMLEARARVMYVSYSGVSYTRLGADARFYPLPWLGVRAFYDSQSLDVPNGSIVPDIEVGLDRGVFGLGVAARF
jgi:hypothetical protein